MVSLSHLHKLKSHSTNERPTQQKPKLKQTNKKNPCAYVSMLPNYLCTYLEHLLNWIQVSYSMSLSHS